MEEESRKEYRKEIAEKNAKRRDGEKRKEEEVQSEGKKRAHQNPEGGVGRRKKL